jgi:hypothetical protein
MELVGFSDASPKAYSAVVFIRVTDSENRVSSSLVCAKTRVAPVKAITIPRLELLGAELLVKLFTRVRALLKVNGPIENSYAFCDSQIVLAWIRGPREKCEVFVRNRIASIESHFPRGCWKYVKSEQNPADLATRGLSASQFIKSFSLWSEGPSWIVNNFDCILSVDNINDDLGKNVLENREFMPIVNLIVCADLSFLENMSSYTKCINVIAQMNRFIVNCRNVTCKVSYLLPLTKEERELAFVRVIKMTQSVYLKNEIEALKNNVCIDTGSALSALNVFLDPKEILRVGGRLTHSNYSYNVKHPIVMPRKSRILILYVEYVHEKFFHAGKAFVCNQVRQHFWVVGGLEQLVKSAIYKCVRCTRFKAQVSQQIMGDLPSTRTDITRPFSNVGVDYTGHFSLKCTGHRSTKYNKVYAAFFVCFVTKATHIEIVEDMTTEAFINAFERFYSRRGIPRKVYSDNGSNFCGAEKIVESKYDVEWERITALTPHIGGLWEAAVKAGKSYLKKAIGSQILTREEFVTIFAKVEAIMNSRPLCAYKAGDSFEPLTAFHLLTGSGLFEKPPEESLEIGMSRRYQLLNSIITSFWRNWYHAYLAQLQRRQKWKTEEPNIGIGDVVIMKDRKCKPAEWPLARVETVFPDSRGRVRVAQVRTSRGVFKRSIHQMVRLPIDL